nr:PREDICTED: phosphatidylinositol-glycan-specific phospholipase D isoform X2 [Latimeria chalumnae]|eukprot:XP_014353713.1 PREDICTED: phosphatidylinositol-glycan-specific phospholipase D isoform X2 [Latimeria chalumnae]
MSTLKIWTVSLILLCTLWMHCKACGLSTHAEIARRALEYFSQNEGSINYRELLQKHQDAYHGGSPYPDAFYPEICRRGMFHQVSEDTHWVPFLKTTVNYIREHYSRPWDEATEKLVVFMFGFVSHIVADVTWHSLGIYQGFLATMGAIDFHGSYSDAHSTGDIGGDVLSEYEFSSDNYDELTWYVPVKDLVKIYEEFYGRRVLDEATIIDCTSLLFLERYGEMLALSKLFPHYAKKSPFLVERFQEYFLGGVDDMSYWTTNLFQLTIHMLENGTSDCSEGDNPIYLKCNEQQRNDRFSQSSKTRRTRGTSTKPLERMAMKIIGAERGVFFQLQPWVQASLQLKNSNFAAGVKKLITIADRLSTNHITSPTASYFVNSPYARLGWAMISADLNQDGCEDLIIGAPGYSKLGHVQIGRVYVVYNNGSGLPSDTIDLDEKADIVLEGFEHSGRFGSGLAALDFNSDGLMDLAVGAPSVGASDLSYTGSVYVYFGNGTNSLPPQPSVNITCLYRYCNLGWKLLAADMNGDGHDDLVIGSPYATGGGQQRGMVAAYYSNKTRKGSFSLDDADWLVMGEQDYSWFGHTLYSHKMENRTLLLTGSPTWRICSNQNCSFSSSDTQSIGRMYGYCPPSTKYSFVVSGDKEMAKLGSSFAIGYMSVNDVPRKMLVVSAPTQAMPMKMLFLKLTLQQAGKVLLYELSSDGAPSLVSSLSGDRQFARFGGAVHLSDLDNDGFDELIVTSPLRVDELITGMFGGEDGRVYIFSGKGLPEGQVTDNCQSWKSPCPETWDNSKFGSAVVTVKSKEKNEVVVAAVRSSMKGRLTGAVHLYSL